MINFVVNIKSIMKSLKELLGESLGTFIIVFFGCGAVAGAVYLGAFSSLLEVAIIWGMGVTLAIFSTRNICSAHLNPAVTIAMLIAKRISWKKVPYYILAQFIGAFIASSVLYFIFQDAISVYEESLNIVRGSKESYQSAVMFGEFFPNPGFNGKFKIGWPTAMVLETIGTLLLVLVIFRLNEKEKQIDNLTPILIGLAVSSIICVIAPFTQAGLNPARDFGPRLFAYFAGWKNAAFPVPSFSFLTVYIVGPILGGVLATFLHKFMSSK